MKEFQKLVSKDNTMQQKVFAFHDMEKEDRIRAHIVLAKEAGIELTEADFADQGEEGELADEELEAVTGGFLFFFF